MENVTTGFASAPPLPPWLQAEFPYQRRLFYNGRYAIHFVDDGSGPVVVLQHGNPTWSYLWRKVIGILVKGGVRVVAPDLVGLGLSNKPHDARLHTLSFHADQIEALVKALALKEMTIVGQDWGGPIIGLVAARNPEPVRGVVFANTSVIRPRRLLRLPAFNRFANLPVLSDLAFRLLNFPIALLPLVQADRSTIGSRELRAYGYPLRTFQDRVAPLALARMMPTSLDHPTIQSLKPIEDWARSFKGPVRLVWGMKDPIFGQALQSMKWLFRKAKVEVVETQAGHFLQEEVPHVLAQAILQVVSENRQQ